MTLTEIIDELDTVLTGLDMAIVHVEDSGLRSDHATKLADAFTVIEEQKREIERIRKAVPAGR